MVEDIEIGWLAGIVDGEGSISIVHDYVTHRLHPTVMITNTNAPMLARAKDIALRMGVGNPRIHPHDNRRRRKSARLYVGTVVGIKTLLRALLPQLTAKREQAQLMLEFLAERNGLAARKQYTARDFEIALIMSDLNHGRVDSVETARAPRLSGAMIQSELHSDVQSAAETTAPAKLQ